MNILASTGTWFRRVLVAVPFAWHYDKVFRRAAIGAGFALAVFLLRLADPPASHTQASAPAPIGPPELGPTYGASATGASPAPLAPVAVPKIVPGRSLEGVTVTAAPDDQFGTVPRAIHK